MPTLQIGEFKGVNLDDSFTSLSPEEQQRTVDKK